MTHPPSDPSVPGPGPHGHEPPAAPAPGPFVPLQGAAPLDPYAQPYRDAPLAPPPPHQSQYTQADPYAPRRAQPEPPPHQPFSALDPAVTTQQPFAAVDPYAQPYAAPHPDPYAQPYAAPHPDPYAQPYVAQPQPSFVPPPQVAGSPYIATPPTYAAQPYPAHANPYIATTPGTAPPQPPQIPGAAPAAYPSHAAYADRPDGRGPTSPPPDGGKKSPWNAPAFGLLAILIISAAVLAWPQMRARKTEAGVKPLVVALSHRQATARCPRYITSVLTNVGSVRLDSEGRIADRTDLTGPVCDGLRHLFAAGGTAELTCLTSGAPCSKDALVSVVSISVVAHESMHLRGQLDEGRAECESIGESQALAATLKIPLPQARMISYLHYAGMNPYTPERYQVSASNCAPVAELEADPPGDPATLERLRVQTSDTWRELAT